MFLLFPFVASIQLLYLRASQENEIQDVDLNDQGIVIMPTAICYTCWPRSSWFLNWAVLGQYNDGKKGAVITSIVDYQSIIVDEEVIQRALKIKDSVGDPFKSFTKAEIVGCLWR